MSIDLTDLGLARRHSTATGWSVTLLECPDSVANVSISHGVVQVFVADLVASDADLPSSFAAASCRPGGEALLVARHATPALLFTDQEHRRVPADPRMEERLPVAPGDVLLMLSCAVFEQMPSALTSILLEPRPQLVDVDPATLLTDILAETASGAGAVITFNPVADIRGGHE